jgi:hypothetical protein
MQLSVRIACIHFCGVWHFTQLLDRAARFRSSRRLWHSPAVRIVLKAPAPAHSIPAIALDALGRRQQREWRGVDIHQRSIGTLLARIQIAADGSGAGLYQGSAGR